MWSQLRIIDFLLDFGLWISFVPLSTNSPWMKKELISNNPTLTKEHLNEQISNCLFLILQEILIQSYSSLSPFQGLGSK